MQDLSAIDSCDYSLEEYQAVADPIADPDLATFSIDRDRKYVLPMLKKAIEIYLSIVFFYKILWEIILFLQATIPLNAYNRKPEPGKVKSIPNRYR